MKKGEHVKNIKFELDPEYSFFILYDLPFSPRHLLESKERFVNLFCNSSPLCGLSAAIRLGSLEKTVRASLIVLWCVLSGFPSLMAADNPCPLLQPSLLFTPFLKAKGAFFLKF